MGRLLLAAGLLLIALLSSPRGDLGAGASSPEEVAARADKDMVARPSEAVRIARAAADHLPGREQLRRRLFAAAARLEEQQLSRLDEGDTAELADVYANILADPTAAARVRREWLRRREKALAAGDGAGRVHLARLAWSWLGDRALAARLCQEALRHQPGLTSAPRMLRDDLGYRLTEAGWEPTDGLREAGKGWAGLRAGLTTVEVRLRLGLPARVARQFLFHRYVEQWCYGEPASLWIEFGCLKGQEAVVLSVHRAGEP
jgi:hypothetical protein